MAQCGEDGLFFHLGDGTDLHGEGRFSLGRCLMFEFGARVLELCREVAKVENRTARECESAFERVPQLANVARPVVVNEKMKSILRDGVGRIVFAVDLFQNACGEEWDV